MNTKKTNIRRYRRNLYAIDNACAWFALEECANKWTEGEEVEDDEGRAE